MKPRTMVSAKSVTCPTQGGTLLGLSVPTRRDTLMLEINPDKYARTPGSVLFDIRLTPEDKMIYVALAYKERGGELESGLRFIGDLFAISKNRVKRSIDRLIKFGHVARRMVNRGDRSTYTLLSPMFGRSGKIQDSEISSLPERNNKARKVCPACHKLCFQILKSGWCRSCAWEYKVGRVVDRKMAKVPKTA